MEARSAGGSIVRLELTEAEVGLLRTALELLEDTLGHEEADELAEVQALLERVRAVQVRG
jgi:hypothetical protein